MTARQPGAFVYFCGVASSLLVVGLVELLRRHGVYVLGMYTGPVPMGAIAVGFASGAGYALAARASGIVPSRAFVLALLGTALVDWLVIYWVTYRSLIGEGLLDGQSFWRFLQITCEQLTVDGGTAPLGWVGYVLKAIEALVFSAASSLPASRLRRTR